MPQHRLAGKRVIVTGAGQGLGREFALHLAGLGANVLAADVRPDRLRATHEHASAQGVEIHATTTDVSDPEQTRALAATANDVLGGLDALVNNAAIVEGLGRRPFDEIGDDEWDRVLEVNVKGAWLCAKGAVPLMRDAGGGSIVNMASEVAFSGSPGLAHYVTSKAAVIGLTRGLARELGRDHIRVNALAPSAVLTDGTREFFGDKTDRALEVIKTGQSIQRNLTPPDLVGAVIWLVSDASCFVTGQTIAIDGGTVML